MDERTSVLVTNESSVSIVEGNEETLASYTISPIVANGDPIGAVIILSKDHSLGEVEKKSAETAAGFLARQMEQ